MKINGHDCYLEDNGTLGTVISVDGVSTTFSHEFASMFREGDGSFSVTGFADLAMEALRTIEEDAVFGD